MIGAREWADLNAALERETPACDQDARFLADEPSDEALTDMRRLCRECPLFQACDRYARTAKPTGGFWAGKQYRGRVRASRPADESQVQEVTR